MVGARRYAFEEAARQARAGHGLAARVDDRELPPLRPEPHRRTPQEGNAPPRIAAQEGRAWGQAELGARTWERGVAELGAGLALAQASARPTWGYRSAAPPVVTHR